MILFYGVWSPMRPGHHLYEADEQRCTLDIPLVDGLQRGGPIFPPGGWDGPQKDGARKGYLTLCMDDDDAETTWYVLTFWDRSGSAERDSIAVFMTDEEPEGEEWFWQKAKLAFPSIAQRMEAAWHKGGSQ